MPFEPEYTLTPHIQRCLVAIDRTVGFIEAVRLSQGDALERLREECRVKEALNSVQIEGNSLTIEQAFTLAREGGLQDELPDHDREFVNYLRAFDAVEAFKGDRTLRLGARDLRELQRILVGGVRGGTRDAGSFRREPVMVGNVIDGETIVHHTPPQPGDVDALVRELMDWLEVAKVKDKSAGVRETWVHPAIVAAIAHQRLAWIHPFVDGNGRTCRMFATILLYQRGYDFKYLFEMSSYYNKRGDRTPYYRALRTADAKDEASADYTEWISYFLGGLASQAYEAQQRAKIVVAGVA